MRIHLPTTSFKRSSTTSTWTTSRRSQLGRNASRPSSDQLLNQELKNQIAQELNLGNIDVTEKEVKDALESLKSMAPLYFNKTKPCPQVEVKELRKLYRKAIRRSFWERIFRSNGSDVYDFHQALMHRTVWECKDLIEARTIQFIEEVMKDFVATN